MQVPLLKHFTWITLTLPLSNNLNCLPPEQRPSLNPLDQVSLSTIILGQIILCRKGAMHCRTFSNTPGLYPLDAISIPSVATMSPDIANCPLRAKIILPFLNPVEYQYFRLMLPQHPMRVRIAFLTLLEFLMLV